MRRLAADGKGSYLETFIAQAAVDDGLKVGCRAQPCTHRWSVTRDLEPSHKSLESIHARFASGSEPASLPQVVNVALPGVDMSWHCCTPSADEIYTEFVHQPKECKHNILLHAVRPAQCTRAPRVSLQILRGPAAHAGQGAR